MEKGKALSVPTCKNNVKLTAASQRFCQRRFHKRPFRDLLSLLMKQIIFLIISILIVCVAGLAQDGKIVCPQISFVLPNGAIGAEQPTIFAAEIDGYQGKDNLQYQWTFSKGEILRGQGTAQIEFIAKAVDEGANFTASVKVSGLPKSCTDTFSDTFTVAPSIIVDPLDEIGKIGLNDYKSRLDNFMASLLNNPTTEGLIDLQFDKNDTPKYKISLLRNIDKHFIFRKFDKTRITFAIAEVDSEERTLLWLVPAGAKFPNYTDTNHKLIKAEELKSVLKELF